MSATVEASGGQQGGPMSGIRVLDFTHVLAGPYCTRLLADFGADVVRVESHLRPDSMGAGTFKPGFKERQDRPAAYMSSNRSKRSITINLKHPGGRDLATRLATVADVVVENFSAGVMARLGLGYDDLAPLNPGLVYASMAGYGQEGPRRDWVSMNVNLQGYIGLMMVTGSEGDPPIAMGNSWCDYVGGLHACFGIVQGLLDRERTGGGRNLDLAQFECNAAALGSLLVSAAGGGGLPPRIGNRSTSAAPQGVYPCAGEDEWCAISVQADEEWSRLAESMGNPTARDSRFASLLGRLTHHDEIDALIEDWTRERPSQEVERTLEAVGVAASRIRRIQDVVDSPTQPPIFHRVAEPRIDEMLITGLPFTFGSAALPSPFPAPVLGQHTGGVLREWLSVPDQEIETLEREGALE